MSRALAPAARLLAGAALALFTFPAVTALPFHASFAALAVAGLTCWRPAAGLAAAVALAPAGLLLAPPPARAAEWMVWSFAAAWLLSIWRPLGSPHPRAAPLILALVYACVAAASWLAYTIGGTAGIEPAFVPAAVARAIAPDHLVFSSPEPETFTLLPLLAGLALFGSTAIVTRDRPAARHGIAAAIAGSAAVLALLTIADVLRQWAGAEYGGWFLLRYVRGERFSLHLADLNAAGSQYVIGGLIAVALAARDRARRGIWIAVALVIAPALWISGSRSASLGGLLVGGSLIAVVPGGARLPQGTRRGVGLAVVLALAGAVALLALQPAEDGTAANALRLRGYFLVTSARMFAASPLFGVGIGHYHERSNEFMPPALREVYGHENAHNYFAQQFAELGIAGGVLFMWFVGSVLLGGWRDLRRTSDAVQPALLAGTAGYLLTCLTGHPLLVPEAAMPFWAALGALAATASPGSAAMRYVGARRLAIAAALILALGNVALQARRAGLAVAPPGERGFYAPETGEDGRPYVWMTRHGVFYVGPQVGTVAIPVQAPAFLDRGEPFRITVEIAGRREGVYDAPPNRWTTIEIPIRRASGLPFRRIDLRANRSWSPLRDRGARVDDQPRSVMVGETGWTTAGAR